MVELDMAIGNKPTISLMRADGQGMARLCIAGPVVTGVSMTMLENAWALAVEINITGRGPQPRYVARRARRNS